MIDIHAPHESVHSWRDFFIHIATIVVGLIIAVGLEQAVEAIHTHRQVREAHEMLRAETESNRLVLNENSTDVDAHLAQLWQDLAVIARARAHKSLPGDQILFVRPSQPLQSVAWQTVHASTVSEHMDPRELASFGFLYQQDQTINAMSGAASDQLQTFLAPLVGTEDPYVETTAQIKAIEDQISSPSSMGNSVRLLSRDNHPDRLTPAQLDAVEQGIQQGIIADRRLQRYLAAFSIHYDLFDKGQLLR